MRQSDTPKGNRNPIIDFTIVTSEEELMLKQSDMFKDLNACQAKLNELEERSQEEYAKLRTPVERKYKELKQPVYKMRGTSIKKVPKFWTVAIIKNPNLFLIINDDEIDILLHLTEVKVKYLEGKKSGFEIRFYFEKGCPYFKNKVISKCMWADSKGNITTESTKIEWNQASAATKVRDGFFGWLEHNDDLTVTNNILLLDFWENPLQYYLLSGNVMPTDLESTKKIQLIEEIQTHQRKIDLLNINADKEMPALVRPTEQKYLALQKPLLEQRNSIISKIPEFWTCALMKHPELSRIICEDEEKLFKYLIKIEVVTSLQTEKNDVSQTTRIEFYFNSNSFIEDSVISKEFVNGFTYGGGSTSSTPVKWKRTLAAKGVRFHDDKQPPELPVKKVKSICFTYSKFFDWFSECKDPLIHDHVALKFLKFWQDPVKFYLLPEKKV